MLVFQIEIFRIAQADKITQSSAYYNIIENGFCDNFFYPNQNFFSSFNPYEIITS